MIEIRHSIPGRMRLKVASLARDPRSSDGLVAMLREQTGVTGIRSNPACGSIIVDFVPGKLDQGVLLAKMRRDLERMPGVLPRTSTGVAGHRRHRSDARAGGASRLPVRGLAILPLTWPALPTGAARRAKARRSAGTSLLCRLQARAARWMLRATIRCWWYDLKQRRDGAGSAMKAPRASLV
ncbi:MAG: hypothetical protein K9M02_18195 [Thiohalocapsa sp.]|nr:hypothetical protein [Thiohalocapsa sp.]